MISVMFNSANSGLITTNSRVLSLRNLLEVSGVLFISFYPSALYSLNFILLVLVLLLGLHHSCVRLQTQLQLYFSSISAFVHIEYNPNSISVYKLDVLSPYISVQILTKIIPLSP